MTPMFEIDTLDSVKKLGALLQKLALFDSESIEIIELKNDLKLIFRFTNSLEVNPVQLN